MESETVYLNLLKTILQSKLTFILLIFLTIFYVIFQTKIIKYQSIYNKDNKTFIGKVEKKRETNYGYSLTLKSKEDLIVYIKEFSYQLGDYVKIIGELKEPSSNSVFNNFNYKDYLNNQKIFYVLDAQEIKLIKRNDNLIYTLKNILLNYINNFKSKNYLKTFLLGDTSYLDSEVYESYQINGVSHLLSISSIHISLLTIILSFFLKKIKLNKILSDIILLSFVYFFMILTSIPISVLRIFIYGVSSFFNKLLKLNISSLKLFLITTLITLWINPFYLYQKGFIYSYSISLILIINKNNISGNYFIKLFKLSMISFLFSLPFNIYFNYSINLLSIIYNLFFVPIFTIILFPMAFLVLVFPFLDTIYYYLLEFVNKISFFLNKIDFSILIFRKINVFILIIYLIILSYIIYSLFKRKKHGVFLLILILTIHYNINYILNEDYFVMIDVSQGDSSLFYSNNKCILVDTGGLYNKVVSKNTITMLKSFGIKKIDILFLTHGDYDHMGDAIYFIEHFKVDRVIFNNNKYNDLEERLIKILNNKKIKYEKGIRNRELILNNLWIKLLNFSYEDENDSSLVMYMLFKKYKIIMMGDASTKTEGDILNNYDLNEVDFLKVGHHGSRTSTSKDFIQIVNPKYALISVGKNNRYHHPNKEVLDNLKDSKIYRTDKNGSIMFKIENNKLKIETCSP